LEVVSRECSTKEDVKSEVEDKDKRISGGKKRKSSTKKQNDVHFKFNVVDSQSWGWKCRFYELLFIIFIIYYFRLLKSWLNFDVSHAHHQVIVAGICVVIDNAFVAFI
jgi:hypothetical protein